MLTHEPFTCPFSWDFEANTYVMVGGPDEEGAHVSFYAWCWVKNDYEFGIDQITLRLQDDRWMVVDWSEIHEHRYSPTQ
jgi:hypothetical protein